jgi:predicted enzyme related to lactoylglutathione lyase
MAKVTGFGGVFFKAENPKELREWYRKYLGVESEEWGAVFKERGNENQEAYNVWSIFSKDSKYLQPSEKTFMINFIVDDCFALIQNLRAAEQNVIGDPEEGEFGKFGWVMDPEGNKIELWEPPLKK